MAIYSRCVSGSEGIGTVLKEQFPWCVEWVEELRKLFAAYVKRKQDHNVLDYDDLLLYWAELAEDHEIGRALCSRFDHILVDEYQDTNRIQSRILRGMRRWNGNIMAVGDDAQSIYSFRSATVRNMLDFPRHFPGTTVLTLEQNYRSVGPILDATNRLISHAKERYAKELWSDRVGQRPKLVTCEDEHDQDEYVVERVLEHYEGGVPLRHQAVLFRAGHLSDSLEVELTRRNIPYRKYGGLRFLESAHVKDLLAVLRIAENPRDQMAWFRLLQLLDGFGPTWASRAIEHMVVNGNQPGSLRTFKAPPASSESLGSIISVLEELGSSKDMPPATQVERIRSFYDPIMKKIYDNPVVRARDLENLEGIASKYRSRRRFLTDLQLDPPDSTSELAGSPSKDEDWLVLSTIHSAKGCEWDVVYLIHAADGWLPSDMATDSEEEIEEERRLAYVAMTRARDFLYVAWPFRYYYKWRKYTDAHGYAQLSRFVSGDVQALFDEVNASGVSPPDMPSEISVGAHLRSRLRAMWE
jgi:DNA helicase-2/ATP-dependent DNA helicase PcrA